MCDSTRCVRAWPAIDGTVRGPLFLIARTSLCAVFAAISAKTRQNLALGGLCGLSCFRPSFRIVLADVCGSECRQTSLCAVFAKIASSPTRNATFNNFTLPFGCFRLPRFRSARLRFSKSQSCKRRCARCLPRNRLEIGVPTFVSYRAGRCLTRLEVWLES